jgi:hypothetical protein
MYTPQGPEFYQIVAISAMCAVVMLAIASLFGAAVAHVVLREPRPVREPAEAPAAAPAAKPAFEGGRTVVVG